jgi:mannose-6-phosphate isomerase-like protein (cupin superfamily)
MEFNDLEKLHTAVEWLLRQQSFSSAVEHLKVDLSKSEERFVWTTVPLDTIRIELPAPIKSCWIFILKGDVPSGNHYHPNSVQHMVVLNGRGRSNVGGVERTMIPFGSTRSSIEEKWHVIGKGIPHEFFPEAEDMTVVSFHTCAPEELEEIDSGSGATRHYQPLHNE